MPGSSDDLTFGSLMICGISTSFIIFATGMACLVVSFVDLARLGGSWERIECDYEGSPPLMEWVLGTGVAFSIISVSYGLVSCNKGGKMAKCILAVANLFVMIWGIVGFVSLRKWGQECEDLYPSLWRMGYAAVLLSFLVCCCGGFVGYKAVEMPIEEAEVVAVEETEAVVEEGKVVVVAEAEVVAVEEAEVVSGS